MYRRLYPAIVWCVSVAVPWKLLGACQWQNQEYYWTASVPKPRQVLELNESKYLCNYRVVSKWMPGWLLLGCDNVKQSQLELCHQPKFVYWLVCQSPNQVNSWTYISIAIKVRVGTLWMWDNWSSTSANMINFWKWIKGNMRIITDDVSVAILVITKYSMQISV